MVVILQFHVLLTCYYKQSSDALILSDYSMYSCSVLALNGGDIILKVSNRVIRFQKCDQFQRAENLL